MALRNVVLLDRAGEIQPTLQAAHAALDAVHAAGVRRQHEAALAQAARKQAARSRRGHLDAAASRASTPRSSVTSVAVSVASSAASSASSQRTGVVSASRDSLGPDDADGDDDAGDADDPHSTAAVLRGATGPSNGGMADTSPEGASLRQLRALMMTGAAERYQAREAYRQSSKDDRLERFDPVIKLAHVSRLLPPALAERLQTPSPPASASASASTRGSPALGKTSLPRPGMGPALAATSPSMASSKLVLLGTPAAAQEPPKKPISLSAVLDAAVVETNLAQMRADLDAVVRHQRQIQRRLGGPPGGARASTRETGRPGAAQAQRASLALADGGFIEYDPDFRVAPWDGLALRNLVAQRAKRQGRGALAVPLVLSVSALDAALDVAAAAASTSRPSSTNAPADLRAADSLPSLAATSRSDLRDSTSSAGTSGAPSSSAQASVASRVPQRLPDDMLPDGITDVEAVLRFPDRYHRQPAIPPSVLAMTAALAQHGVPAAGTSSSSSPPLLPASSSHGTVVPLTSEGLHYACQRAVLLLALRDADPAIRKQGARNLVALGSHRGILGLGLPAHDLILLRSVLEAMADDMSLRDQLFGCVLKVQWDRTAAAKLISQFLGDLNATHRVMALHALAHATFTQSEWLIQQILTPSAVAKPGQQWGGNWRQREGLCVVIHVWLTRYMSERDLYATFPRPRADMMRLMTLPASASASMTSDDMMAWVGSRVEKLGQLIELILDKLVQTVMRDPEAQVRRCAATLIDRSGANLRVYRAILHLLRHGSSEEMIRALRQLSHIGVLTEDAWACVAGCMQHDYVSVRLSACQFLAEATAHTLIPVTLYDGLLTCLTDHEARVRVAALTTLRQCCFPPEGLTEASSSSAEAAATATASQPSPSSLPSSSSGILGRPSDAVAAAGLADEYDNAVATARSSKYEPDPERKPTAQCRTSKTRICLFNVLHNDPCTAARLAAAQLLVDLGFYDDEVYLQETFSKLVVDWNTPPELMRYVQHVLIEKRRLAVIAASQAHHGLGPDRSGQRPAATVSPGNPLAEPIPEDLAVEYASEPDRPRRESIGGALQHGAPGLLAPPSHTSLSAVLAMQHSQMRHRIRSLLSKDMVRSVMNEFLVS
ncbi:hypothetical protein CAUPRSCDRAFT_10257 [Caulochytrium protostelioides]|nr:hypothetical protein CAUPRSCDRAFT_10257 [Caulochytrium protostelioides]